MKSRDVVEFVDRMSEFGAHAVFCGAEVLWRGGEGIFCAEEKEFFRGGEGIFCAGEKECLRAKNESEAKKNCWEGMPESEK